MHDPIAQAIDHLVNAIRQEERQALLSSLENSHRPNGHAPTRRSGIIPASPHRLKKGKKRDPRVIGALTQRLHSVIKARPGRRIEEIAAELRVPTKDLLVPVARLFAAKAIRSRGWKRAMRYFPK